MSEFDSCVFQYVGEEVRVMDAGVRIRVSPELLAGSAEKDAQTGKAVSRGYCYACPTPIEVGEMWRWERVGNAVPHRHRLVHHPACPQVEAGVAEQIVTNAASAETEALVALRRVERQIAMQASCASTAGACHDDHRGCFVGDSLRFVREALATFDPPTGPDPERAICDHRFPDGTFCKLTRAAHEDVPGLAALHRFPPGTTTEDAA